LEVIYEFGTINSSLKQESETDDAQKEM